MLSKGAKTMTLTPTSQTNTIFLQVESVQRCWVGCFLIHRRYLIYFFFKHVSKYQYSMYPWLSHVICISDSACLLMPTSWSHFLIFCVVCPFPNGWMNLIKIRCICSMGLNEHFTLSIVRSYLTWGPHTEHMHAWLAGRNTLISDSVFYLYK